MSGVAFIRCECGESWRHEINLIDGKPVWIRPKSKRGERCKHEASQAEVLIDGEWKPITEVQS